MYINRHRNVSRRTIISVGRLDGGLHAAWLLIDEGVFAVLGDLQGGSRVCAYGAWKMFVEECRDMKCVLVMWRICVTRYTTLLCNSLTFYFSFFFSRL